MNLRKKIRNSKEQWAIIRLWALRAKYTIEIMSESKPLMSTWEYVRRYNSRGQEESDAQGGPCLRFSYWKASWIECSYGVESSEEIFVRNPDDHVKTKGHPKCPTNYNQYLKHHKERKGKN